MFVTHSLIFHNVFFMLGLVHTYRFHLKTEILLSSSAYRAKMPPGGSGGVPELRETGPGSLKWSVKLKMK